MKIFKKVAITAVMTIFAVLLCGQRAGASYLLGSVQSYVGAGVSGYYDGNSQSAVSNKMANYKGIVGLRLLGLVSVEAEYSQFNLTSSQVAGVQNFDVSNTGFNLLLTPPLLRIFGNGLEGIVGVGLNQNRYTNNASGQVYKRDIPKAIFGLRFMVFNKLAVFATSEFMTKQPQMATEKYAPIVLTTGVNIFF